METEIMKAVRIRDDELARLRAENARLKEALRDMLEDYDSIKFSCGHHALTGSVLEQARALLEERERQK